MRSVVNILVISVLLIFSSTTYAGNEAEKPTGSISGKVIDNENNEAIPYATVALYPSNDTSHVINGVATDENGTYMFNNVLYGNYDVKISFVGYNSSIIRNVILDRKHTSVQLTETILEESLNEIEGVEIIQERLKGEEHIDKTVFTVNDQVRSSSTSGLDMLKHIPAVSVDFQENVTLEGRSDILFYVDGVERNKDFIAQIDPSLIDKVEIMTNPGVKYSADISGVINIILVKEPRHGINGSIKMDIPHPKIVLFNPRGNIEYGNQNFRTFAGYRMHMEKFDGNSLTQKEMNDASTPYYAEIKGTGENMWQNGNGNYGFDWFINESSSLNFYSEINHHNGREKDFIFRESTYINDILTDYQINNKNGENGGLSTFYSLFYKKKFNDQGSELTLEGKYYDYNGGLESHFAYTEYDPDNLDLELSERIFTEKVDNNRSNGTFKADYSFVSNKIKHETGYHGLYQWMKNEKTLTAIDNVEEFKYNELRNVGYYSITGSIKKLTLQGGIRYENSIFQIPGEKDINFDIWLPQFKASYKINDAQNLKLSYRRQVYRPNIQDLNPFEIFIDSTMLRRGNPDMKPVIDNKTELSYSTNFKSNYISSSLYYTYTQNGIAEYSKIENDITVISQANILDRYEYGLSLNGAVQLHKRVRLNFYAAGFNRNIENDGVKDTKLSYRTNLTNIFILPKDFVVFAMMDYSSPNINYQRVIERDLLFIMGVEKNLSKRAKISGWYNPFITDFTYRKVSTVYGNNVENWYGSLYVKHVFAIEFTYSFNYGKKVKKINRSVEYEKDGNGGVM